MPRLIVNADDFGLTAGVNRGIVELYQAGVVSSASLMATGWALDNAVALAKANPGFGVGCHLVFVDGIPVSHPCDIPTLLGADGKTFRPSALDFAQAALRGTIRAVDLVREAQAQIQKLQRAGLDVTHVDTHKHTHLFPPVAEPVLHTAERCGVMPVRYPFEPAWSAEVAGAPLLRRLQLRGTAHFRAAFRNMTKSRRSHGQVPDGTLGISATGTLKADTLRATLLPLLTAPADSVWELCCHPGFVDEDLEYENTRLRESREIEYRALLDVLPEFLRIPGAPTLIHYGELGVQGLQRGSGQFIPFNGYEKVL